jgi:hypothetical protein
VKKFMMLGALVAVMVAALAIPALAKDGFHFGSVNQERLERWQDRAEKKGLSFDEYLLYRFGGFEDYKDRWDHNDWWKDHDDERRDDRNDRRDDRDNDVNEAVPAVEQSFEQEAESGDVNQSFNVSNKGDNSNQCAGIQGVANTGNAQNQISVVQNGSTADDFSFENSGASITVSPNSFTSCDQEVNQAATATGW